MLKSKQNEEDIVWEFICQFVGAYLTVFLLDAIFFIFGGFYITNVYNEIKTRGLQDFGFSEAFSIVIVLSMIFIVAQSIIVFTVLLKEVLNKNYITIHGRCQASRGNMRLFNNGRWYKMKTRRNKKKVFPGTQCDIVVIYKENKKATWDLVTNPDKIDIADEYYTPDPELNLNAEEDPEEEEE